MARNQKNSKADNSKTTAKAEENKEVSSNATNNMEQYETKKGGSNSNGGSNNRNRRSRTSNNDSRLNNKSIDVNGIIIGNEDPSNYMKNSAQVEAATNISFNRVSGFPLNINIGSDFNVSMHPVNPAGIMQFRILPIPGIANNSNDGVNLAAARLFQDIRSKLSTVGNYAPADVIMYILAVDSILSLYSSITRAFGTMKRWNSDNMYVPRSLLLAASGLNEAAFDKFVKHLADYRNAFNTFNLSAAQIYLPVDFTITQRHMWLFSNYFVDSATTKAQFYVNKLGWVYMLDEKYSDQGTALRCIKVPNDIEEQIDLYADMINTFRNSTSMMMIASDMRRAYADSQYWKLEYIPELYFAPINYSPTMLSQIANSVIGKVLDYPSNDDTTPTWNGYVVSDPQWFITQSVNKNIVLFQPYWKTSTATLVKDTLPIVYGVSDKILNFHHQNITTEDVVRATRNMFIVKSDISDLENQKLLITSASTDLILGCSIIKYDATTETTSEIPIASGMVTDVEALTELASFDWHPVVFVSADSGDNFAYTDFDVYTSLSNATLANLNNIISMSVWDIPSWQN